MQKMHLNVVEYNWQVIINPNALSKKCYDHWDSISKKLDSLSIHYQVNIADEPGSGKEFASVLCKAGKRHFIIIGGDGTLNEVINGIFVSGVETTQVFVAPISLGTGNDWGKSHHYPKSYLDFFSFFMEGQFLAHDIGLINSMEENRLIDFRYFINIAGFCFDAEVIQQTLKMKRKIMASKVYLFNLLKVLLKYRYQNIQLTSPDFEVSGKIFTIAVGICQYNGNGMHQVPMADPTDGLLDIIIIRKLPIYKVLKNVKNLYTGTHIGKLKEVEVYRTSMLEINSKSSVLGEVEGEMLKIGNYKITMIPQSVNMLVPPTTKR